jgi:predicted phage terminase large subunit-like protein
MTYITPEQLEWALTHREEMLRDLDQVDSASSLLGFTKLAWKHLEPGTPFVPGWPVEAISEHLEAVSNGQIKRLLINVPPGCMKSLTTNVFWPAWEWGPRKQPQLRYISASYEKGLATRDLVRCRDLIQSEWYQALWPIAFKDDQNLKTYYQNTEQGWRLAASVGGALTGYRADRVNIDDPHDVKSAESERKREESLRWFTETLPTRLNRQSESTMVVVMQRLHERDISGLILKELSDTWEHLMLPMEFEQSRKCIVEVTGFADPRTEEGELLWPDRFNRESVEQLKETFRSQGGSYAEAAQLQQRPAPRGGGMFKRDHFHLVDAPPRLGRACRGWDLAATKEKGAAFTVGAKLLIHSGKLYICDLVRRRASPFEVEEMLQACARLDGLQVAISIPQDPGQASVGQKGRFASLLGGYNVHFSPESGDKADRAKPFAAQVEAGNVFVVRAPWNDALFAEAELFPNSEFKDQIDALSRAYSWLLSHNEPSIALEPAQVIT